MNKTYIKCLLGMVLCIVACVDDKGSYDYIETPDVNIVFDEYMYTGVIGEEVKIIPQLIFPDGVSETEFTFEWQLNGEVVSTEQQLTYVPSLATTYYVLYSVIHKASDIRVMKNLQLSTKSPFKTGWAILSNSQDNSSLLTQVRDDNGKFVDYMNVYEKVNKESLGSQPFKLVEHHSSEKKSQPEVLVINHDAKGPLELEGNSMTKVLYTTQEFTEGVPEHFKVKDVAYMNNTDVVLTENGQLYIRKLNDAVGFHSVPYSSVPVYFNKGLKIGQLVQSNFYKAKHLLMWDELNHRFLSMLSYKSYATGNISEVPINGLEGKALVYVDAYLADPYIDGCRYVVLLKDNQNKYTFKTFDIEYDWQMNLQVKNEKDYLFPNVNYLTSKSKFYQSKDENGTRFYFSGGADNRHLYYYQYETQNIIPYTVCDSEITDLQVGYESTTLGVGMKDRFVVYAVDDATIVDGKAKKLHEVQNIGEVVDVIYRYGSRSNMYR